jgi:hypothetical protein
MAAEQELVQGKLWGICEQDARGTTIRITRRAPVRDFPIDTERVVFGSLGWDPRFPGLHLIEYQHVEYSVDYGASLICISCEQGPGRINRAVLEGLSIFKFHDTTQRGVPAEHLKAHVAEYRWIVGNGVFQWLAIIIQGNIQEIPDNAFVHLARPAIPLSVAVVDMRDSHVRSIGKNAFLACKDLQRIFLSRLTESIGSGAFAEAGELPQSLPVPKSFVTVAKDAFRPKSDPRNFDIDDGVPPANRVVVKMESKEFVRRNPLNPMDGEAQWLTAYSVSGGRESVARVRLADTAAIQDQRQTKPIPLAQAMKGKSDDCTVY